MITVRGLSKNFGKITALDDVCFDIKKGEIVALLGANGAGKTTLLRILAGLLSPDGGCVFIDEEDIAGSRVDALRKIGYVPENSPLYDNMTVFEFLQFTAGMRGLSAETFAQRTEELIRGLDLSGVINRRISGLSKGFRHRVGIAGGIIHNPEILLLDEPAEGLDPNQKFALVNFIKAYASRGIVLLSTHIMEDVEAAATRILLLDHGRLVKDTTPERLRRLLPENDLSAAFRSLTTGGGRNVESLY